MTEQSFGTFELIQKLAIGGMAEVWLARQHGLAGLARFVVVKRILPHLAHSPEFVHMLLNEARIASRFRHPNIGQIYDLGEQGGSYFIAMEFIHGEDLGRVMRRAWRSNQWVARPIAFRVVADACRGLYYAHSFVDERGRPLNVVHRDVSPQNILISFDGAVKLVDFGIAKAADQVLMTRNIKGKFAYMSPEQAGGMKLDARTDVFALGLVLYELITGVRPLKRDSETATLQAALVCAIEKPSDVAEVPESLDDVVMRALAKNPGDRYRDAQQFQMALEQYLVQEGVVATSVQVSELMATLFADRLREEARTGRPTPTLSASEPTVSEATNPDAAAVIRLASRVASTAQQNLDPAIARSMRLTAAMDHLGAVERALHGRLRRVEEHTRLEWRAMLEADSQTAKSLSARQLLKFLTRDEMPSLKTMAHWSSERDGPQPPELAALVRAVLSVPSNASSILFDLGQCRNVLAHRHAYESERRSLDEAASFLQWVTAETGVAIDISEEKLNQLASACSLVVQRRL